MLCKLEQNVGNDRYYCGSFRQVGFCVDDCQLTMKKKTQMSMQIAENDNDGVNERAGD